MKPQTKSALFLAFIFTLALVFSSPALAQNGRGAAVRAQVPAATGKATSCDARLSSIKKRMTQLVMLSENMFKVFDSISTRVQTFYAEKVLPTNTVPDYQALLDDVQAKKTAASAAISSAQADVSAFSCIGDVGGLYNGFRLDMQAVKTALKAYRTSIRNLIVAVHSVAPEPETTATPTL